MYLVEMPEPRKHYFVDDSALNVKGAKQVGWNSYLFDEDGTAKVEAGDVDGVIKSLQGRFSLLVTILLNLSAIFVLTSFCLSDLRIHWQQFLAA